MQSSIIVKFKRTVSNNSVAEFDNSAKFCVGLNYKKKNTFNNLFEFTKITYHYQQTH